MRRRAPRPLAAVRGEVNGDDTAWLSSGDVVAAPPAIHEHLLALIASCR
mgnify:CR=1 FL=1